MSVDPHVSYGTYDELCGRRRSSADDEHMSPALSRVGSRARLTQPPVRRREKDIAMRPLDEQASGDSRGTRESVQAGVKQVEAIAKTWDTTSLALAYLGIGLIAWATSLESLTTSNLTIYATSAFNSHSLVSTVLVIQGVVLSVVKPPMSKIADVFGRFEAFCLSVILFVVGYVQQAASDSVGTYAAAQLFYAAGSTGLQILIQILIADTSDLVNRALCITLPDLPFLVNVWLGPTLAETLLSKLSWRWGYGIWAVILPVCFLPLAISLIVNKRKAKKRGLLPESPWQDETAWGFAKHLWHELDVFGLLLICSSFTLILLPLTLASRTGWLNPRIIIMLAVGIACLIAFPLWERSPRLAPRAFFPRSLLGNRTVLAAFALAFFYFMAFYLSIYPYFQSYLLVVMDQSLASAGRIIQTFTFAATVTSFVVSFLMKSIKRYKFFMVTGTIVYILGIILMFLYRREGVSTSMLVGTQAVVGIGGSLIHLPAQVGVQASGSHQEVAAATALFLTLLEIGGAVGSAISGAIWTNSVPQKLAAYLPDETKDQAGAIYGNITLAANGWPMGDPTRVAINRAYQETMTQILIVAICVSIPCFFLSLLMEDYELDKIEQQVKGVVIGGDPDNDDEHATAGPSSRRASIESGVSDEQQPLFGNRSSRDGSPKSTNGSIKASANGKGLLQRLRKQRAWNV